ncbi:diacylglycerol/lipid kinase family protein [Galbitalea soli]|uniref:Diacylglycerol kinase n=1 Tax=Galbitalea soli TaxID=1268042 RepID=A0A7C9PMZ3_9MICO|nr:diacylglycerol kinase family protein [Galbitalea soli]NEM91131.1 diacylglycerol kinase [Galbitalea soli]NYJ29820.1 diacylglycerol kinase family enzyme [Galbitalea soli]
MTSAPESPRTLAIIVNPSKFDDIDATKAQVAEFAAASGWNEPRWFESDPDDGGVAAAREALQVKPDLVCAMGGDGTVRAVASVLRGTGIPYGLLPSGTGNLLARNLGIPLDSLDDALQVAFRGQDHPIDVGLATFDDGQEHAFVVMGGVGFDATIMDKTDDKLKKKVGWAAYAVAGGANLFGGKFSATLEVDGAAEDSVDCLMVLACNCSSVIGGIEVAPGATVDDGQLDVVMLRPNIVAGWVGVAIDVAIGNRNGIASIRQWSGREFEFTLDRPVLAELDGDPIGETASGRFGVDPDALLMRLPVPAVRHPSLGAVATLDED